MGGASDIGWLALTDGIRPAPLSSAGDLDTLAVTHRFASESSAASAAPMSSGSSTRPSATCEVRYARTCSLCIMPPPKSVTVAPGGDGVDTGTASAELLGLVAGEDLDRALDRAVGGVARDGDARRPARDAEISKRLCPVTGSGP